EPAPAPPLVMIESWNELQEGAILLATKESGYSYGEALARTLGLPWTTTHTRTINTAISQSSLIGSVNTPDGWLPCADTIVHLQRRTAARWHPLSTRTTTADGSFSFPLREHHATYRVQVPANTRYRQTCA